MTQICVSWLPIRRELVMCGGVERASVDWAAVRGRPPQAGAGAPATRSARCSTVRSSELVIRVCDLHRIERPAGSSCLSASRRAA